MALNVKPKYSTTNLPLTDKELLEQRRRDAQSAHADDDKIGYAGYWLFLGLMMLVVSAATVTNWGPTVADLFTSLF